MYIFMMWSIYGVYEAEEFGFLGSGYRRGNCYASCTHIVVRFICYLSMYIDFLPKRTITYTYLPCPTLQIRKRHATCVFRNHLFSSVLKIYRAILSESVWIENERNTSLLFFSFLNVPDPITHSPTSPPDRRKVMKLFT